MKKKRLYLITTIALLAALFGSGGGTAWGQAYKSGYVARDGKVELRRGNASNPATIEYIGSRTNVNNEFGAGESATFLGSSMSWPAGNALKTGILSDIHVGSQYSKNIVINNYNAGGYAAGFLDIQTTILAPGSFTFNVDAGGFRDKTAADNPITGYDPSTHPSGIKPIYQDHYLNPADATPPYSGNNYHVSFSHRRPYLYGLAGVLWAFVDIIPSTAPSYKNYYIDLYLSNHVPKILHHWRVTATEKGGLPYTSTAGLNLTGALSAQRDTVDDGVLLIQTVGQEGVSINANVGEATAATTDPYVRPTTVALGGSGTFKTITFQNLEWWVKTHNLQKYGNGQWYNAQSPEVVSELRQGCGHMTDPTLTLTSIKSWDINVELGTTKLDAAVQLLKGARICVKDSVLDNTGNIGTTPERNGAKTDAVIVVPFYNRFTLRTKGAFKANMVRLDKDSVDTRNVLYGQAQFPIANHDNILLKSTAGDIQAFAGSPNMIEYPSLVVPFHNKGAYKTATTTKKPYNETEGAVFGVHGDYLFAPTMAEIHTDTVPAATTTPTPDDFVNHNMGVIEVGPRTANKSHFHIYGKGMLKNFESDCNGPTANFAMEFGDQKGGTNHGGTPSLRINTPDTLYIVNFGNNGTNSCDADLRFYTTSVDSIHEAFKSTVATGYGALQIQALNSVRFRTDGVGTTGPSGGNGWDATTNGNDIYVLSDAGNISTQKLNIKSDNVASKGHGYINFLAAGDAARVGVCNPGTRNSGNGNIYFNDEVKIERTAATSTQTNIIAQNNIRTAKFTSTNPNEDTTNILSRMGDIWLGYSVNTSTIDPTTDVARLNGNGSSADNNVFTYNGTGTTGQLNIMAGWDDSKPAMTAVQSWEGGNVYFTHLTGNMAAANKHNATIAIPYSSEYICDDQRSHPGELLHNRKASYQAYEHSGIIGGVGACGVDPEWSSYAGLLEDGTNPATAHDTSLVYHGNEGNLILDAGRRGNIIMNRGSQIEFQDKKGNATFRTREGDIDMRDPTDVEKMKGSLLFLAQLENLSDLAKIGVCGCDEERNNVYLQDFQYKATGNSGSVFIGADNNIKLNYGGLTNIGTRQDPFLSQAYKTDAAGNPLKVGRGYTAGGGCGTNYHCDLDGSENQARDLILNFRDGGVPPAPVTSGGFAAVASDMIDVYKNLIYTGGKGSGLSAVPGTGTLHGENVAGYGLFMKTQGNKANWTDNILLQAPKCPTTCQPSGCDNPKRKPSGFLHNTVRMTFHGDARFYAENQRVHLESPVIETFGVLELNAKDNAGSNAMITIKTDSLICHDSLIRKGTGKVQFSTWSGLPKDLPIIKLGYSRKSAPFAEYSYDDGNTRKLCRECVDHYKGKVYGPGETPLDTIFVKFGPDTEWERQNVMVIDHTVITFLTDSFDHVKGGGVLNARYFVDTTKIRNQVEFWTDKNHERDGHLELISERQMGSKDYAGLYTKHLHLEPIGACGHPTSEMWLPGLALDVITTSTFGGFGIQYTDVHVENGANLNPGFTSLRLRGQCYEQACGTLTMKDLRLDGGAELHFSVGTTRGLNGEFSDAIDVDKLTTYGPVNVNIEIRPCEEIEKRCYPLIYYKSVSPNSLNTLKLHPATVKIDGEEYPLSLNLGTDGVVYLCVGDAQVMDHHARTVTIPTVAGVKTNPGPGIWEVKSRSSFPFRAVYTGKPLVVRTNRMVNGVQEVLGGVKNANGEYEYIIPHVQQEITLTFGPDVVSNEFLAGAAVWSHGEMIYIRVERADIASIYSVAGQLVKRVDLPEGDTSIPMSRGAYVITLKDGSVHKVIVK